MRVTGLDGRERPWSPKGRKRRSPSGPHLEARTLLAGLFPACQRLEEVSLPGSGGLRLDFYLPQWFLAVEVHGEQHYRFIPHFHGDRTGWMRHQQRDRNKAQWCEINGIRRAELRHDARDGWGEALLLAAALPRPRG